MKIIDLSTQLYDHMPVYPGDPDVVIKQFQTFLKDGWNMKRMQINLHDGTHVNLPIHGTKNGKTLNDFDLDRFMGQAALYVTGMKFAKSKGIIFHSCNINEQIAEQLIKTPPKFIGLSKEFEFDIVVEKLLLAHDIISYENLINTDKLPQEFMFYGLPLNIRNADGSPVRAFAMV